jgi:hypothetical protein
MTTRPFVGLPAVARILGYSYAGLYGATMMNRGVIAVDAEGRPLLEAVRIGGRWKVRVDAVARFTGLDPAIIAETIPADRTTGDPRRPRRKPAPRPPSARNLAIIAAWNDGATSAELADRFGITKQRVSQLLHRYDLSPKERRTADADARVLWACTRQCRVCAGWYVRPAGTRWECSENCAFVFRHGRRYFIPGGYDRQRRYLGCTGPPNRRYAQWNSKLVKAIIAAGRADVLPARTTRSAPPRQPCPAPTIDGQPCARTAPVGGVCHIHGGGRPTKGQQ